MAGRTASVAGMLLVFFVLVGTVNIAEGRDFEHGAVMVAVGGGYIEGARLQTAETTYGGATFSFFVGLDKLDSLKGSLVIKRVTDGGARAVMSTEITNLQVGLDDGCTWMEMVGNAKFKPAWGTNRSPNLGDRPNHTFTLDAWDCDDGADWIWFEVRRSNGNSRGAMSLYKTDDTPPVLYPAPVAGGHIMIPYPVD